MERVREMIDGLSRDRVRSLLGGREERTIVVPLNDIQWRASGSGDGTRILSGYAAVYGQETVLYDGLYYDWREIIALGAFNAVLARQPLVHFNLGHDMNRSMASTHAPGPIGKLELSSDAHGLKMYARLNPDDPDVHALTAKMDLGIMDQASFKFTMTGGVVETKSVTDASGKEHETDTLIEIGDLIDVCVCARGAYQQTEAVLRSFMASQGRAVAVPEDTRPRSQEVPGDTGGAPDPAVARKLLALKAKTRIARADYKEIQV